MTQKLHNYYRLEFEGVDVGVRWNDVYDACRPRMDDHITPFNDLHYLFAFIGES